MLPGQSPISQLDSDCSLVSGCGRFTGLNGQVSEFRLKPNWTLPLQEEPEDWDINPATEDLPLDQILANAAAMRREHLEGACTSMSSTHGRSS